MRRIYKDSRTTPFFVRVRETDAARVTRLAARIGMDPVAARRRVFELGVAVFEALEAVA